MARILALSSFVAHGHVGLSAAVPVLQALGHSVTQVPTVILSNHPGWPRAAALPMPPDRIGAMLDALAANGWLGGFDAMLTGYLPSPAHVEAAAAAVDRMRAASTGLRVVVDPILGDAPGGLYLAEAAARALARELVPRAGILTPNLFELGWITGRALSDLAGARDAAGTLIAATGIAGVHVTSAPLTAGRTGVLAVGPDAASVTGAPTRRGVPHGVGDVYAALTAAGLTPAEALGHLSALAEASLDADHLKIAEARAAWTAAPPLDTSPYPGPEAG